MRNKKKIPIPTLIVEKTFGGLEVISDFVQRMCTQTKISFKKTWELMMAVDEICSSFITCSCDEGDFIQIVWEIKDNKVEIIIEENGSPFNPLENFYNEDNIYGLGPEFIKKMVDNVQYKRENGLNKIKVSKKIRKYKFPQSDCGNK